MKNIVYFIVFFSLNIFSQTKYLTRSGTVSFEASVPAVEEVKAKNESVTAILNTDDGAFAALIFVKGFRFKNALMEEHFNENYAESDTYPKATFKGKINSFSIENIGANLKMSGPLTFHGKTKEIKDVVLNMTKNEDGILITGAFIILASDFDIKIPKIVKDKVSENVEISFDFNLKKK